GIAGSRPLETGLESWKLAKGLYVIPLLFIYTPSLFEGPAWQVIETAAAALLGLYCFASFFEGFHLGLLTWPQRLGYAGIAACLLWPHILIHGIGMTAFILFVVLEKAILKKRGTARAG
ncbi:MAG TPA: TRAP transporter permease, partial [Candidatus Limnocylindria bacterium]|nr:TRAP transporter permease [Candidatus Limnocylindria bacterium]